MNIEWNKVTWYSKIVAIIIFVGTFFLGFWLGTMKAEKVYVEVPRVMHRTFQIQNTDWMKYFDMRFGTFTIDCDGDQQNVTIDKIEYGDLNNDGEDDAVVKYYGCWNGSGGGQSEVFTLLSTGLPTKLTLDNAVPEGEKKLFEGSQGHGYYRISKDWKLQYDFPIYKEGDSNCCPTGGTKSIVYKWNKTEQQFEVDRIAVLPPEKSQLEEATTLGTPKAIIVYDNIVSLLLPMRECDKSYAIERSYNQIDWREVGTTTFYTYQEPYDHNFRSCENDFIDSHVATGTKKLWYRYGLLDEKGDVTFWSNTGEVTMDGD